MICEKCGRKNEAGADLCRYCGTEMPKTVKSSGFADILSFFGKTDDVSQRNVQVMPSDDHGMKKVLQNSNSILRLAQKNTQFVMIAIAAAFILLISDALMCVKVNRSVNTCREEILAKQEEILSALQKAEQERTDNSAKVKNQESGFVKDTEQDSETPETDNETAPSETNQANEQGDTQSTAVGKTENQITKNGGEGNG